MEYRAKHRFADVTARKLRPFAQLIRGRSADEAMQLLKFYPNRGARQIEAVLQSAIANAADQGSKSLDDLIVSECRIDDGPMYKRMQPRARGTAFMILKRLAHIIVAVKEPEDEAAA